MCIFKKIFSSDDKKDTYVKVTENGSLYVEISDLLEQDEFKKTVSDLLNSEIIKRIEKKQKKQLQTN